MARRKKKAEINIFSASAIDLFASSLGVFIILVIILFPYFGNKSKTVSDENSQIINPEINQNLIAEAKVYEVKIQSLEKFKLLSIQKVKELKSEMNVLREQASEQKKLKPKSLSEDLNKLKKESQIQELKKVKQNKEIKSLKTINENLKRIIKKNKENLRSESKGRSFLAFLIKWETKNHDVDLVVRDPSGKRFDFKKRKFKKHVGEFILDSRSGPGAEVWQSKKFIPGVYSLTYRFYNDYGNNKPVIVSGTVITKKGSFDIKKIKLDSMKNPLVKLRIRILESGEIKF